ncbi:MAG: S8 family peptidase, partial [Myxococcales bacterium]|nr:S8 family peptidase [Myxococcales bacterium]
GHLTTEAVARAEVSWPLRNRVIAMAVTARESRDRGRPSAWSAAVDRLASDGDAFGANPRLLVASAGNVVDQQAWGEYPHAADSDQIHDPAQAWNALTVGASTELVEITDPDAKDYAPIAQAGGLSPFSTTSLTWKNEWPLKPDVVMEGGNAAKDSLSAVSMSSLSLLTTHHEPEKRLFTTSRATSAAAAQTARMACQVAARYPHLWPETIRGLVVHSAEWTDQMKSTYLPGTKKPTKNDFGQLVRRVGFGIPDLEAALWSASNSLTLIVQESLHPFEKQQGQQPRLREMHLHDLPWPREALEALGETEVEMRVTLSYFIEPNPSARGRSRYRYESHGLRFDVRRPMESVDAFRARINAEARDAETGTTTAESDSAWILGKQLRHRGSLHSDRWQGAAVALASRDKIAVVPTVGWWRSRPSLERVDSKARYALIVSIEAPEVETDLYAEVAAQVGIPVEVEV